jgi:LCP family protein required for cell wall assembly
MSSAGRRGGSRDDASGTSSRRPTPDARRLSLSLRTRRAVALLVLQVLVPGSAELAVGNRRLGLVVLRTWAATVLLLVATGLLWLVTPRLVLRVITSSFVLGLVALLTAGAAVVMTALLVDAWRLARPDLLPRRTRIWLAAFLAVLVVVCAGTLVAVSRRMSAAADLVSSVFSADRPSSAVDGRFNVLLLGGDAGPDRVGTRPDSITLASIDATTGSTVLFGLPRNLEEVPFAPGSAAAKALPRGFSCGDACLLNGIYTWGSEHRSLFPGAKDPGAEAMKEAVQGVTGLRVNYYVLIDLKGFEQLIDALGGIRLTVTTRVPIGGVTSRVSGYLEPGPQTLDGYHALWFARSRHATNDYDRMARQRCVMNAMLRQLDPATVLERFQAIAVAGRDVVSTDVPAGELATFLALAAKARGQKVTSVQFVPPLIQPAFPDFTLIRGRVAAALAGAAGAAGTAGAAGAAGTAGAHGAAGADRPTSGAPPTAQDPGGTNRPSAGGGSAAPQRSGASAPSSSAAPEPPVTLSAVCAPA